MNAHLIAQTVVFAVCRWIHLAAVIVAIGGAFGLRYGVLPTLQQQDEATRRRIHEGVRRNLMMITLGAIGLIIVSGIVNLVRAMVVPPRPSALYQAIFGIKMLFALALFTIATYNVIPTDPPNAFQRNRKRTLGLIVHLGLTIVALSVTLRFLSGK